VKERLGGKCSFNPQSEIKNPKSKNSPFPIPTSEFNPAFTLASETLFYTKIQKALAAGKTGFESAVCSRDSKNDRYGKTYFFKD
jgi:hypothetical protein